jgi:hypothetical protein
LKTTLQVVVAEADLAGAGSFSVQEMKKLKSWFVIAGFDLNFLLDDSTPEEK